MYSYVASELCRKGLGMRWHQQTWLVSQRNYIFACDRVPKWKKGSSTYTWQTGSHTQRFKRRCMFDVPKNIEVLNQQSRRIWIHAGLLTWTVSTLPRLNYDYWTTTILSLTTSILTYDSILKTRHCYHAKHVLTHQPHLACTQSVCAITFLFLPHRTCLYISSWAGKVF